MVEEAGGWGEEVRYINSERQRTALAWTRAGAVEIAAWPPFITRCRDRT